MIRCNVTMCAPLVHSDSCAPRFEQHSFAIPLSVALLSCAQAIGLPIWHSCQRRADSDGHVTSESCVSLYVVVVFVSGPYWVGRRAASQY
eukprot:15266203-Alexandrium_andersonii.AAC.1